VSRGQRNGSPRPLISVLLTEMYRTYLKLYIHNVYLCKYMRKLCSYYFHAFLSSSYFTSITTEQQLRRLGAGFSPRRPWFSPRSVHLGFVADTVVLRQVFFKYIGFSLPIVVPVNVPFPSSLSPGCYNGPARGPNTESHPAVRKV
jgi:hypothetical protein